MGRHHNLEDYKEDGKSVPPDGPNTSLANLVIKLLIATIDKRIDTTDGANTFTIFFIIFQVLMPAHGVAAVVIKSTSGLRILAASAIPLQVLEAVLLFGKCHF